MGARALCLLERWDFTRETKDLPVSEQANESFLARRYIHAALQHVPTCGLSLSFLLAIGALKGFESDPQESEVTCFTAGHYWPTHMHMFWVTNFDHQLGNCNRRSYKTCTPQTARCIKKMKEEMWHLHLC